MNVGSGIGSMVGGLLGGPVGAFLGHLVGGVAGKMVEEQAKGFVSDAATAVFVPAFELTVGEIAGERIREIGHRIVDHCKPDERRAIGDALQAAFRDAVVEAVYDVGGHTCFPALRRTEGARTGATSIGLGVRPWDTHPAHAAQVRDLLEGLARAAHDGHLLTSLDPHDTSATDVYRYLPVTSETIHDLSNTFYREIVSPYLEAANSADLIEVRGAYADIDSYLRRTIFERTVARLGDEVRRRPEAWRTFNELILDGMRASLETLLTGQSALQQGQQTILQQLDHILAHSASPAAIPSWSDDIATFLTGLGSALEAVWQDQQLRFDDLVQHLVTQNDALGRIEVKLDRVLDGQPLAAPPAFTLPFGDVEPIGRTDELDELDHLLDIPRATVAISGMGGLGKTFLAAASAHRARADGRYPGGIFWLRMDNPADVAAQVAACGGPSGLAIRGWQANDVSGGAQLVHEAWRDDTPRLLIFDNLDDPALLREWQPTIGGCRVLITSHRDTWPPFTSVHPFRLRELQRPAARQLLCAPRAATTGQSLDRLTSDPAADAICDAVGDLPLALALAGAYLAIYQDKGLSDYQAQLAAAAILQHQSMSARADMNVVLPTRHAPSVAATIALSYQPLLATTTPIDTLALTMLRRAALLAPAPIPRRLLLRVAGIDLDTATGDGLEDDALRRLSALGLLREEDDGARSLHRLVAAFVRTQSSQAVGRPSHLRRFIGWVRARITSTLYMDMAAVQDALSAEAYALCEVGYPLASVSYLPHLRLIGNLIDQWPNPSTAASLSNLGLVLQDQGDLAGARALHERALAIREAALLPDHLNIASSLNNLGGVLQAQGDLAGARALHEQALAIREAVLPLGHPSIAISLGHLASVLRDQGDFTSARALFERALAICEAALPPVHPDVASSLDNLATVLQAQGDLAGARALYERALAIREAVLPPDRPDVASSLNNLATVLQDQGDLAGARALYERALAMHEAVLPPDHPNIKLVKLQLASL